MIKYTVLKYYIDIKSSSHGQIYDELQTDQVTKFFSNIKEAEAARITLLNENFNLKPQDLRVVQYEFK